MSSLRKADPEKSGFALLEVLVATAVAVVLLAALMRVFSSVWLGIGSVREEAEAAILARSLLEASATRNGLAPHYEEGRTAGYSWGLAVALALKEADPRTVKHDMRRWSGEATPDDPPGIGSGWQLYRLTAVVQSPSGRRTVFETLRLAHPKK